MSKLRIQNEHLLKKLFNPIIDKTKKLKCSDCGILLIDGSRDMKGNLILNACDDCMAKILKHFEEKQLND